jgi:hypothetical protein
MAQAYNTARSNANTQRVNAATGQAQVQGQQLGSLFNLGEKSGLLPALNQGISSMAQPYVQRASSALGSMFPSWNGGGVTNQPMVDSPYGGGGDFSGYTTGSPSEDPYQGTTQQPMNESPYANYSGNYQDYTTGALDTAPYNQPTGTDLYDQY